ncbi:hypothetical protein LX36DRAFT_656888 [Colletotrichum falcatum]|nr:hypothetical protein LX36DRAFT_656888 [Colletotrichum falcatum]
MKYSAVIVALAGVAAAQTVNDLPQCAQTCLLNAIRDSSQCGLTDTACLCNNFQAILAAGTPCVAAACGAQAAVDQVFPAAARICQTSGGGVASSAVSAASSAASAAVSSAAVSASSRASAAASPAAGTASSPITSSARAGVTRTAVVTSTVTTVYNGTRTFVATATTTQVPVTVNGAPVQGPIGLAAALALGALAYL